jgi:DNA polymerase-3 subunit gamma/tau
MSYVALYRKWRPLEFEDVIGQDHIVKTLTNQIKTDRIAHAYLFCGTRGTGKTTTAKIFAKSVNCESPIEGSPCNNCSVCNTINNNQSMNMVEIDAASNNGVDNIREIREEVKYTPTEGKYKVYIIDEVHMLSTGAFNALLKTLEEPPKHVIFILATTEPHKIPATILSRCQRYDFKRISINTISNKLISYMEQENIEVEEKAIKYIAKVADGSMRDALSILDQCIAFYIGEKVTLDKVLDVLGAVDSSVFVDVVHALHNKDAKECMNIIDKINMQGRDLTQFLVDITTHLRNVLITKSINNPEDLLDVSDNMLTILKNQSNILEEEEIIYYIKVLSELENKIKYLSQKRIIIEVEFVKLCHPSIDDSVDGLVQRIQTIENKIEKGVVINEQSTVQQEASPDENKKVESTVNPDAYPEDIKNVIGHWSAIIEKTTDLTKSFLKKTLPCYLEDDYLYIVCESDIGKKYLSQEENISTINNVLESHENKKFRIKIIDEDEYNIMTNSNEKVKTTLNEAKTIYDQIKAKINFDIDIK